MLMQCCNETYDLGCAAPCSTISIGELATQDGTYQVEYQTATSVQRVNFDLLIGEDIAFESFFNEDSINRFAIIAPDLNYVTKDGIACFSVTIR